MTLRDARPGCFPRGSLRGPVLNMTDGLVGDGQQLASKSMRFKVRDNKNVIIVFFL